MKIKTTRNLTLLSIVMLILGATALVAAVAYNSQISAFIGLGLIFWGAILTYIRSDEYARKTILDAATEPQLQTTIQITKELGYTGNAVYLPPRYLKNHEESKLCILKQQTDKLPTPEQIQKNEDTILTTDLQAILLTPPGAELTKLFEKTLNTNFTKVDLTYVQQNLPKLLIEDLEIAENVNIEAESNIIRVTVENTIFGNTHAEAAKSPNTPPTLGNPLSSAIACVLAKATGKPVTINKEQTSANGKTINIEYGLLEEKEEEPPQ